MPRTEPQTVLILGGDGFCGWPVALDQSDRGRRVIIADNLSRRKIDADLGTSSLTPIHGPDARLAAWRALSGRSIDFVDLDASIGFDGLVGLLEEYRPDAVVHLAEQRSAPYSMLTPAHRNYSVRNNVMATQNLLSAISQSGLPVHIVHIGSVGVYGYSSKDWTMPEGYLTVRVPASAHPDREVEILHPFEPVSVYHLSKCLDAQLFEFYARHDRMRITDLHQGVVWGSQTRLTSLSDVLINRFDYDSIFGTVVNRFLVQAAMGHSLTVYGTGEQTRAFIHLPDAVHCVNLALENPPAPGQRARIRNQVAECLRVVDVATMVATQTGAEVSFVDNPRVEDARNSLAVANDSFAALGFAPTLLRDGIWQEAVGIAQRFRASANPDLIQLDGRAQCAGEPL
ncbi:NAD-dependent epimerase/dehydratase family protein [Dactylosporangium sp. NPDC051485]|uniref:NAD-dependent epimerase/dehydratase family protein n=1 Tax=Dactylosporangium sp. NPDC051485 TaxID=3154846 RepID=UPI00343FA2D3